MKKYSEMTDIERLQDEVNKRCDSSEMSLGSILKEIFDNRHLEDKAIALGSESIFHARQDKLYKGFDKKVGYKKE